MGISKEAFQKFQSSSEKNNPYAMCFLGKCYEKGWFIIQNAYKAFTEIEKSTKVAEKGIPLRFLASCYQRGVGVPVDNSKAISLYEKAAALGDSVS